MSVRERAGFLSPDRESEMVGDSENKEVGNSRYSIFIYAIELYAFLDNH